MALCLLVSLLPMQPSAVALPNSQPVGASGKASRVVPIFISANSQQPVMTGYLYSSRIVFAIDPASGSQDFYVGLPKSLASTTGGRVKVAKVFASQSIPAMISNYSFAFNRFAIFVLEKDLIAATPAELLTPEMDIGSKGDFPGVTTAYSYGEYQNRNSPGSQKPCEGGPCSKDVRSLQLKILALKGKPPVSVMPNFRDQFIGQIILENSVDPKAGIACYGDAGAPVVASYRNRELYMGAIADQFYVKACGAFPQATYDKDGKMIEFGYDTDIAINFISPVYKHTDLINRAKEYAKTLVTPSPTPSTNSATPSPTPTPSSENANIPDCTTKYQRREHFNETRTREVRAYARDKSVLQLEWLSDPSEIGYKVYSGYREVNPTKNWLNKYNKDKDYKVCRLKSLAEPTAKGVVIAYRKLQTIPATRQIMYEGRVDWKRGEDVVLLEAFTDRDVSTMDMEGIIQSSDPALWRQFICGSNEYVPIYGLFQSAGAASAAVATVMSYMPGQTGVIGTTINVGVGSVATISTMLFENKWNGDGALAVAAGTITLLVEKGFPYKKLTTFTYGNAKKFQTVTKLTNARAKLPGTGTTKKSLIAAEIGLTYSDIVNLLAAYNEVKNGENRTELKKQCTAAYK